MVHEVKTTPVSSFVTQGSQVEQLLQYPFLRPEGSYITDGETVTSLPNTYNEFCNATNRILSENNLPGLSERVPVLAYGANVSPSKISEKMSKYGSEVIQKELQVVPMIEVSLPDSQVVWHGKPGQGGSTFSDLYTGTETKGKSAEAVVQFLTTEQLALIHATEGVTYHFTPLEVTTADDVRILALAYVAGTSSILLKDGKPVEVKLPGGSGEGMTAREAVGYMLEHAGHHVGVSLPEELIALNTGAKLSEKKQRQALISSELSLQGRNKLFSHPAQQQGYLGRGDFNDLQHPKHTPKTISLTEQSLARLRPTKAALEEYAHNLVASQGLSEEEARRKAHLALDIMQVMRNRIRAELQDRLDQNTVDKTGK